MKRKFLITLTTMLPMISINNEAVYSMEDISKSDTNFNGLNDKFWAEKLSNVPEAELGQAFELVVDLSKLPNTSRNEYDSEGSDSKESNWNTQVMTFINDYYKLLSNSSEKSADVFGQMRTLVFEVLPDIMTQQNKSGRLTMEKLFKITDDVAKKYKEFRGGLDSAVTFDKIKDQLIQSTCRLDTELLLERKLQEFCVDAYDIAPAECPTWMLAHPFWNTYPKDDLFYSARETRVEQYVEFLRKISFDNDYGLNELTWFLDDNEDIDYMSEA